MASYFKNQINEFATIASYKYKKTGEGLYYESMCFINAYVNKYETFKHLNLKIVGGTLSLDGWEEYGGSNRTMKEWLKKPTDIHFWLEDENGNVYDFLFGWYNHCAKVNNRYYDFPNIELKGVPKSLIEEEYKIKYIPTTEIIYKVIFKKILGFDMDTNIISKD
jgi:hypothetical protein